MIRPPKTQWLKAARNLILVLACSLYMWTQTQPADKPDASAKPSPSPSVVGRSPVNGSGNMGVPYRDLGVGKNPPDNAGSIQILSDTTGVDFGPYMKELRALVQKHWDPLIPESAMPPMRKRGRVVIEFAIMKDGSVQGMRLVNGSGDLALDRAAWGAISSVIPLPALPAAYRSDYLRLRTSFYYNPDPVDFAKPPTPTPQPAKQDPKN